MNKVISPLKFGAKGATVADLQDALQLCIDKAAILPDDATQRRTLSATLVLERKEQSYGDGTRALVSAFQTEHKLTVSGDVDAASASSLNAVIQTLSATPTAAATATTTAKPTATTATAKPTTTTATAKPTTTTATAKPTTTTATAKPTTTTATDKPTTTTATDKPTTTASAKPATTTATDKPATTTATDTPSASTTTPRSTTTTTPTPTTTNNAKVAGTIVLEHGVALAQVKLKLYQRDFGGVKTLLGEVTTDQDGGYTIPYKANANANIEIHALGTDGQEVQLSETRFGAQAEEKLDLVAPSRVQPPLSEFARLKLAVAPHMLGNDPAALKNAVERGNRRDFTLIANASGWDVGALALASEAFDAKTETNIPADGLYALARAGLPTNPRLLAQVSKQSVARALRLAAEAGIVDKATIEPSIQAHAKFAADHHFSNRISGALSSPQNFVEKAGLSSSDNAAFTKAVQEDADGDLWQRAKDAGVSPTGIEKLQLQGKLAYLTCNNAALTAQLASEIKTSPLELIALGYHDPAKWQTTLSKLATASPGSSSDDKLDALIPPAFSGQDNTERLEAYSAELARRVRQMDTHAVTLARIASGTIGGVANNDGVRNFLKNAAPLGFRLGQSPLSAFIADNQKTVWNGISDDQQAEVLANMRTLTALYAASPDDDTLNVMLVAGFSSVTALARSGYQYYSQKMRAALPKAGYKGDIAEKTLQQVFWKAQQQTATVFNVFDGLKRLNTVGYAPGSSTEDTAIRDDQIVKTQAKLKGLFPTLETLFGSVDYCQCDQCQSVLSPAAYLVDILHFLDPDAEAWATAKAAYQARTGLAYTKQKPFDALNARRPDIKNIALTCENTNTSMPYIDIINEILEQLMMADTNAPPIIEAYDVGEASSQDLIAEPQNILWAAYVGSAAKPGLRERVYPLELPFDLPLAMARAFLGQLGLPLSRLRQYLAQPTTLNPAQSGQITLNIGWTDVWFEQLGLGPAEVAALCRKGKWNQWYELYGYSSSAAALQMQVVNGAKLPAPTSLRNAKTLARSLGISYLELVELVRTRFINPEIESLISCKRLGLDPHTIDSYLGAAPPLDASEKSAFEADLAVLGVSANDVAALRTAASRKATLLLQSSATGCDFANTTLGFDLEPQNPDQDIAMALRKMNAFVRLQKKLGWSTHELDRALMALMPSPLNQQTWSEAMATTLVYLAHVEELRTCFQDRLTREQILILWSDIPTQGIDCLYERLFQSPGALGRNPVFEKRLGRVLQDGTLPLAAHAEPILQALQLAHTDIEPILLAAGATDRLLSIKNISTLMRYALFAKGLDLPLADLLTLLRLSWRKPLSPLTNGALTELGNDLPWRETLAFVRELELAGKAGASPAFLARVCLHHAPDEPPVADIDPLDIALAALPPADPGDKEGAAKWQTVLVQTLAAQLSTSEPMIKLLIGSPRKDAALPMINIHSFADAPSRSAALAKLRAALTLIQGLAISVEELQALSADPNGLNLNQLPLTESADAAANVAARLLYKQLGAWLELVAMRKQFGRSERLLAVLAAARQPVTADHPFAQCEQQLLQALTALTGMKEAALTTGLAALEAVPTAGPMFTVAALATPKALGQTLAALQCFTRLGLQPGDMVQMARNPIDATAAQKLRAALKARYQPSAWRRLAQPIFDGLRQRQRDALVAHLTHVTKNGKNVYGDSAEKLFEYLLLDPGMEPVVLASRIQLAIASVQLFVQRCLMNFESSSVDPDIIDKQRWDWMRRYRVWEVNRKMFIWPENWLDPEFRDDKTHLFRELEGKLLQGEVSDDSVRSALHTYLKGLEQVARLHMLSMYLEPGASADSSIMHVVGRTANAPHKYYHRQCAHGMWTPWEPIDVGIEGDHLVLTAWRGRMHLFWVSFLEQGQAGGPLPASFTPGKDTINTGPLASVSQVQLQVHWVEQIQGKWGARNSTANFVNTDFTGMKATSDDDKRKFFVRAVTVEHGAGIDDDDLELQITQGGKAHTFTFFSKLAPPLSKKSGQQPLAPPYKLDASPVATKWQNDGPLQVNFTSKVTQNSESGERQSGSGYHTILSKGSGSTLLFPSNQSIPIPAATAPSGVGRPSSYVFRPQDARHIAYRAADGAIHDVFGTKNGWYYQSPSLDAASVDAAGATEAAVSDPHAYTLDDQGTICIAYAGASKIHELIWKQLDASMNDPQQLSTGWYADTLYQGTSDQDMPAGRPCGGLFLPQRGVVFRTKGGRLRAAVEDSANASWIIRDDLIANTLPKAVSDPVGLLMTKTELGKVKVLSRHIVYLATDGNVYELVSSASAKAWAATNITQNINNIVKPAVGAQLAAYAFLATNSLHVVYRGSDSRIHELWRTASGTWNYNPIGAKFTKAVGDPSGYATEKYSTQHVVYRGEGNTVVELWGQSVWQENVLSKTTPDAAIAIGNPAGDSFESHGTQQVTYFTVNGALRTLWWDKTGWHADNIKLSNPFPDELGPLAAPFFYESATKDHSFFAEPYVLETAVHEWTEWVITTKQRVHVAIDDDWLIAINPKPVLIKPSGQSIIQEPPRLIDAVYDPLVTIRTNKGVIDPPRQVFAGTDTMLRKTVTVSLGSSIRNTSAANKLGAKGK